MTLQAKLTDESFLIGELSNTPQSVNTNIVYLEVNTAKPISIPNTTPIDDLIKEFESDPEMALAMSEARSDLSTKLYSDNLATFASLRLSAGLSQTQLADKASTSQPYIAKIEAGKNDPGTDVIARLANALQMDESLIFMAIRNQRKTGETRNE